MKKAVMLTAVLFAILGTFAVQAGLAATYKYVDKNGVAGFADDLQTIPEPYRATAVLISGEAKEGEAAPRTQGTPGEYAPAPRSSAPVHAPVRQEQPQPQAGIPFINRLTISIALVIATILLSVFLGRIDALHGRDRTIHVLRVSLSWLVVVYLIAAHAKDVWNIFKVAGHSVQSVSAESANKGEKAAKAIQALDAAVERAAQQAQEADKAVQEADRGAQK